MSLASSASYFSMSPCALPLKPFSVPSEGSESITTAVKAISTPLSASSTFFTH